MLAREQLIPMFGLTQLSHEFDLETSFDKIVFLCRHTWSNYKPLSTAVSFGTLFTLIAVRSAKDLFKKYWFIYRIPEVLLVVIASTGTFLHFYPRAKNKLGF
jgi:hypothetical protein